MKTLILFLISIGQVYAQECDKYINDMAIAVENNDIPEAESKMEHFVKCKENLLGNNHPIIRNLERVLYITAFENNVAIAKSGDGKYVIINENLSLSEPLEYDNVWSFREGLATVTLNGKWGFIDKNGSEVIPLKYDIACDFSEGLVMVILNGKCGFIDKGGNDAIPLKYDIAHNFSEGLAIVALNGHFGFIDKSGKEVIALKYDFAYGFSGGSARVELNGKLFSINKQGKCIKDCQNDPKEHPIANKQ